MIQQPEINVLEVALSYGYSTCESFSRAFKKVWGCNPSEFRENPRYFTLFPKCYPPSKEGDIFTMPRNVDISELYELFTTRKNCYFICCDVERLELINAISYKAGDMAILESLRRMEQEAGDEDVVFRIGGNEFTMLTASEDVTYAEAVAERIRAYNGKRLCMRERRFRWHCISQQRSCLRRRLFVVMSCLNNYISNYIRRKKRGKLNRKKIEEKKKIVMFSSFFLICFG